MTDARPVDRHGLDVLSHVECWALLGSMPVGRVAFVSGGEPSILPVTYAVVEHSIVFRTGLGSKMMAAHTGQVVAFEVDEWEGLSRTGWSVLARGPAETVHALEAIERFQATATVPWLSSAAEGVWIRIRVEELSGRRLADPLVSGNG